MDKKFTVPEISCGHCKETIEKALDVDGVSNVMVDIDTKAVSLSISDSIEMTTVASLLDEQGYTVVQS
ncbi:MAG: heavy-metal-associated domain-containing protein [Candidatus Actinomarina sp.]|jgi:copper chaperone|nr:heavy-metal-associated domain-containing protein [Actinomycetota bacterium]MBL6833332.1 heavy-metal-associated domain-containing protein [Candidatus Actinomarina sp.]MBL6836638.1 heavy-metal-associated domain-containing protein [Candidatus Actinomarina sp.]